MIYGIPLFGDRVAPRCTIADSILFLKSEMNQIVFKKLLKINEKSWNDLFKIFKDNKIETLVCGGISYESSKQLMELGISVIDNVACSGREVIEAVKTKTLKAGFGFSTTSALEYQPSSDKKKKNNNFDLLSNPSCLYCEEHQCNEGKTCILSSNLHQVKESKVINQILNSALDISLEDERTLCRLSELIYFALEMNYKKIGIAYCSDLSEPAEIVSQVLRRFFDVTQVCCKIGGKQLPESTLNGKNKIVCNPRGQADILNMADVDLNIIIGLCIGIDCIFTKLSKAPVSTLFVKDKSLSNNPIGAVYLDHYLKEAAGTEVFVK